MENRITSLLLPVLLILGVFFLMNSFFSPEREQGEGQGQVPAPTISVDSLSPLTESSVTTRDREIVFEIGSPGEVGFRAVFDNQGGALRSLHLMDQWDAPGLGPQQKEQREHLYPAIEPVQPEVLSFLLEDFRSQLPIGRTEEGRVIGSVRRLHEVPWPHEEIANGLRFWLELESGLRFERDFEFLRGSRIFRVRQRILNRGTTALARSWGGQSLEYWFHGAMATPYRRGGAAFQPQPMCFAVTQGATGERLHGYLQPRPGPRQALDFPDVVRIEAPTRFLYGGSANTFFTAILRPADEATANGIQRLEMLSLPFQAGEDMDAFSNCGPLLVMKQLVPVAGEDGTPGRSEIAFDVYVGPKSKEIFTSREEYAPFVDIVQIDLERGSCFCSLGSQTFSSVLLSFLRLLYGFLGNWGVAIIVLTLLVRAALAPLNLRQAKAMREYGARMKVLKPKMDALRKKYEKDPKEMNRQLVQFQRENKLFPPLMGCLPMLLTIPVFIGLFLMLRTSFEVFHQPFALWIQDLSVPDRLFRLGLTDLPLLGDSLEYFNLLPVLMVALWAVNAFRMPLPDDPQQRQMQQMMRFMPIVMGIFLYNYASGLALYMVVSAVWTLIEQTIVRKKFGPVAGLPTTM